MNRFYEFNSAETDERRDDSPPVIGKLNYAVYAVDFGQFVINKQSKWCTRIAFPKMFPKRKSD